MKLLKINESNLNILINYMFTYLRMYPVYPPLLFPEEAAKYIFTKV